MKVKWINLVVISLIVLCVQLIACSSQPDYVGKWQGGGVTLELTEDGHIIYDCPILEAFDIKSPVLGTYEPYGEEYIKVSFDGTFGASLRLSNTDIWEISIAGNSMVVDWGGNDLAQNYKRVR